MESLIQELKKLNLSEKEARVYIALLELGPSTPYKIAKRSHLKRPTAYVIAEELVEKGLIVQMTGEKKRLYIAKSPETYIDEVEARVQEAKKVMPELLALQRKKSEKPNILYFEGVDGFKEAYNYRLEDQKNKETVGFFARANNIDPALHESVFFPWNKTRITNKIKIRAFTVDDPELKPYVDFFNEQKKFGTILKFLPDSIYGADCSLEILDFGVRVMIIHSKQALIVESTELALAMKQIFELLWKKTEGEYDIPEKLSAL